jgi:hypothetical protein
MPADSREGGLVDASRLDRYESADRHHESELVPKPKPLERLVKKGAKVYSAGKHGNSKLRSDDKTMNAQRRKKIG